MAEDPRRPSNNVTRLQGSKLFRLRIGDWRAIYDLDGDRLVLYVLKVGPRGSVYDD